jgi:tRNA modification GTPase
MSFADAAAPIVAVATPSGRGAVGIVRVSGRGLGGFVKALLGAALHPRRATLLPFPDARGEPIDRGLALFFPAPHSYTGEDVLELQGHGGPVVLQLLIARCFEVAAQSCAGCTAHLPGLRLARPGEFTERAFLNNKLDLAQAEAVADLIDAGTEAAARSAVRAMSGALSQQVQALAAQLVALRTLVEATLDFPEEDIDFVREADVQSRLDGLAQALSALRQRTRQGALLREGLQLVLAGQPNVGKSSLLNALAGAELAIVTPIPGTTRDKVSSTIQIDGVPIHVTDTAGLRNVAEAADEVERIGIERSWAALADADAIVLLHDASRRDDAEHVAADVRIEARLVQVSGGDAARVLHVFNKCDLAPAPAGALALSARTGAGLDALKRELLERAGWLASPEGVFIARTRHLQALARCETHVQAARQIVAAAAPALELLAEELRLSHQALSEITGEFTPEDLLGEIFGRFCVGK